MSVNYFQNPSFLITLSSKCNAHCSYCFSSNDGEVISIDTLKTVNTFIEKTANKLEQKIINIIFHGGEPLLAGNEIWDYELSELTKILGPGKVRFTLQSNLWNLNEHLCELFKKFNVNIGTSLDGPEILNDLQRGKGYYSRTMKSVELAEKHNLKTGFIVTFTKKNLDNYKNIFNFFAVNHSCLNIHGCIPVLGKSGNDFALSYDQFGKLILNILELYLPKRHFLKIDTIDQFCSSLFEQESRICTFRDCLGMFLAFDTLGNIYPCQRFCGNSDFILGNVKDDPSLQILSETGIAKKISNRQENVRKLCNNCEHFSYCKGGCLYNAWTANNDIDPYCDSYKKIFNAIKQKIFEELESPDNLKAIAEYSNKTSVSLFQKGAIFDLAKIDSHPMQIAENALKIVSYVKLAEENTKEEAVNVLKNMGINIDNSYYDNFLKIPYDRVILNNLYIHLTFNCQLHCNHCYANSSQSNITCFEIDQIEKIIFEAQELNFEKIIFTGGEPLLHPQFNELLDILIRIKDKVIPLQFVLRTNFTRPLSIDDMKKISYSFHKIFVSIDGDKEYHEDRRGTGTYDLTVENLKTYRRYAGINSAEPGICSVLPVKNSEKLVESVKKLSRLLGIKHVRFRPVLPIGRANKENNIVSEALNCFQELDEILINGYHFTNTCGIGQNLYVEPDGNSFPCYAYHKPHAFLGNVFEKGLKSIITSDSFRKLSKATVDTNHKCKKCRYRYLCGGTCRSWGGDQVQYDLNAPPPECSGLFNRAEEIYLYAINYLKENKLIN